MFPFFYGEVSTYFIWNSGRDSSLLPIINVLIHLSVTVQTHGYLLYTWGYN